MGTRLRGDSAPPSKWRALKVVAAAAFAAATLAPSLLGLTTEAAPGPEAAFAQDATAAAPDGFVARSGASLTLDGAPFRFVGFNLYDAAASDLYSCAPAQRLDDAQLAAAMLQVRAAGGTVVRFWAFQSYTRAGTDYSGVDRVISAAREQGLKVLPVLENQWGNCSRPGTAPLSAVQGGTWFSDGYRSPLAPERLSFREYASRITAHYRDEPVVFAWSLMNEAETHQLDPAGRSVLVNFASDMASVVHAADPHHLLTLGTQSNGAPGASGADFSAVYGVPGLDLAEVHDWANRGSDSAAMPGAPSPGQLPSPASCQATAAPLACSFALVKQLGKPIIVAEAGIAAYDGPGRALRARQLGAKVDAAFEAGASGYLVWQLNRANTDGYAVLLGAHDPLSRVLRAAALRWASSV
ncbi:glycoside hydrolase family 5 protein [Nocardioides anomalus]|uniref:mannan endo-1,4-beta-mannosidase n=1 Tax=Nocardioides anomalus TaxID=2712223 RepID=A0A6G6WDF3_9ACTN|nr:cellulase family glycosylhydrolase [Nocardioides anomalus]QIG43358.1 glycoside hydrolase family 5 protein [Nocardioides anomalus]